MHEVGSTPSYQVLTPPSFFPSCLYIQNMPLTNHPAVFECTAYYKSQYAIPAARKMSRLDELQLLPDLLLSETELGHIIRQIKELRVHDKINLLILNLIEHVLDPKTSVKLHFCANKPFFVERRTIENMLLQSEKRLGNC
jgi:hypothetical protein